MFYDNVRGCEIHLINICSHSYRTTQQKSVLRCVLWAELKEGLEKETDLERKDKIQVE